MISIGRHIELLLLEHDCVIVPGFGGFIASHNPAQYRDDDKLYLPPYRTVAFNDKLTINDGLLVQSYMAAYDASYPAACLQIEADVAKVVELLDNTGECVLDGVGTLHKAMGQGVTFSSFESGVATPCLYGLYSFEIHSLEQEKKDREIQEALRVAQLTTVTVGGDDTDRNAEDNGGNVVALPRRSRWKEVAVASAAAVVLFAALVFTAGNGGTVDELSAASVGQAPVEKTVKPKVKTPVAKAGKQASDAPAATEVDANPNADTEVKLVEKNENVAKYTLVMASYVSKSNADLFIANLSKAGFPDARYVKTGKVSRVLYSGYATENEAYTALHELRRQSNDFAQAWIMAL